MPPTLLPFLYQTRTLQRLCAPSAGASVLRAISTTSANAQSDGRRIKVKRDDIPFQLPDDFPVVETGPRRPLVSSDSGKHPRGTITPTEREAFERIFEEIAARGKPPSSSSRASPLSDAEIREGMTGEGKEQRASWEPREFGEIMPASTEKMATQKSLADQEYGRDIINVIIQDAEQKHSNARRSVFAPYDPLHPLEQISSAGDKNYAFLKFPPSLREAAGIAFGVAGQDKVSQRGSGRQENSTHFEGGKSHTEPSHDSQILGNDPLGLMPLAKDIEAEAKRRPERTRVTALIKGAKSDFELWDIMEAEVFTMVDKLGLGEKKQAKKTRRKGGSSKTVNDQEATGKRLSMDVHGPLYPEFLLLGLQQMDRGFAHSSTLALSILPRIKQLGLASYVLGISTSFYYRLMQIQWYRYGNGAAVLNLLEEMRHAGLSFDENCLRVLNAATSFHLASQNGSHGNFLQQLMRMPEFEHLPYRFNHWKNVLRESTGERERQVALN